MSVAVSNQINIHKAPFWSRDKKKHPNYCENSLDILKRVFWVFVGSFFVNSVLRIKPKTYTFSFVVRLYDGTTERQTIYKRIKFLYT